MRIPVPNIDNLSLAGCAVFGIELVDDLQWRTSELHWPAILRQSLINRLPAPRQGASRSRCSAQWSCQRPAKEIERYMLDERVRASLNESAYPKRFCAARRRKSWSALSSVTRPPIEYNFSVKQVHLLTYSDEFKKNTNPAARFAACDNELAGVNTCARESGCLGALTPAHHQSVVVKGSMDFAGQLLYFSQAATTVNRESFVYFLECLICLITKLVSTFNILGNAHI